ncbi:MAG TPA: FAD-dependent oxidoreductase, partial [Candidatus Absconditabacterales bacterium]|nr:FAD-dependent oxidoreductase [Candidatus Absconditabacterales bacterium]
MEYQNRWYLSLLGVSNNIDICPTLEKEVTSDYLIIGGGVAGLHAAQELIDKKCTVTLIEKSICGGGMSGRSGGFLTPDSELGLRQIQERYGAKLAKKIWNYGSNGQQTIVHNIKKHDLKCDLREEDSLLLGLGKSGKKAVHEEHTDRKKFGLSSDLIDQSSHKHHNSGECYTAGVRYTDCYAINPMQYCQELKQHLLKKGVNIYEFTHVHKLEKHFAKTNLGGITFKKAIICTGKAEADIFPDHAKYTYGIQNYITISEP